MVQHGGDRKSDSIKRNNVTVDPEKTGNSRAYSISRVQRESDPKRWTQDAVGALLGVARQTVQGWFTNAEDGNGKSPPPDARVKLTTAAKEEIVRRIEAGEKQERPSSSNAEILPLQAAVP